MNLRLAPALLSSVCMNGSSRREEALICSPREVSLLTSAATNFMDTNCERRCGGSKASSASPRWLSLLLALGWLVTGCSLKQAAPVKTTFLIDAPRTAPARATAGPMTVRVRPIQVAEPFEGREFVYRKSELNFESDF